MTDYSKLEITAEARLVSQSSKSLGAFYTADQVADFLVWWAIRSAKDCVLDPSFGGGVFLRSACKRLVKLGGQPASQVFGVELDHKVYARIADKLSEEFGVKRRNLLSSDFFEVDLTTMPSVDAVIGNPPFIRYQRFSGDTRKRALNRAEQQGVHLNALSSSWAPFLIHSVAMLKQGGRLAMVVPMEIAHAAYALPVLRHLVKLFNRVTFLTFQKKPFPDLSEDTLLVLAEDKGSSSASFFLRDLTHADSLAEVQKRGERSLPGARRMSEEAVSQGRERLIQYLIPKNTRELYRELKSLPVTKRLGELADVGIGYVTGGNDFFHLHPQEAQQWGIPKSFLKPAVRRGRALNGLRFTTKDWHEALASGEAGYLLHIQAGTDLPDGLLRYLKHGEAQGIANSYKCRTRSPWFCVPHVYKPDAFLSYMSGVMPRLVANDAHVIAPNSLHILRLHPQTRLAGDALAALWQTSLTRLSVEIEGHALGGGMLKLEPTEAENILVAALQNKNGSLEELIEELDALIRNGDSAAAQARVDTVILRKGIGLSQSDCYLLQKAAETLRNRRYSRSAII